MAVYGKGVCPRVYVYVLDLWNMATGPNCNLHLFVATTSLCVSFCLHVD